MAARRTCTAREERDPGIPVLCQQTVSQSGSASALSTLSDSSKCRRLLLSMWMLRATIEPKISKLLSISIAALGA